MPGATPARPARARFRARALPARFRRARPSPVRPAPAGAAPPDRGPGTAGPAPAGGVAAGGTAAGPLRAGPRPAGTEEHAWDRMLAGWHAVFGLLVALTAVLVAIDDAAGTGRRAGALAVLAVVGGAYAAAGARALRPRSERLGLAYLVVAAPCVVALFALVPVGSLLLFILYPQIWALLPWRRAIAATAVVLAGVFAVSLAESRRFGIDVGTVVLYTVIGLFAAVLLGTWISRVIEQSRQRAELVAELTATRAELAAVSRQAGVLAERERLAREIHDTLAQGFTGILLLLDAVEDTLRAGPPPVRDRARGHLELARRSARENLAEARALVAAATPAALAGGSLTGAVARLTERAGREGGLTARHEISGPVRALPTDAEVVLLRAAQEALANVRRHAAATAVTVTLDYAGDQVTLEVRDDGIGFDGTGGHARTGGGFGLAGMRRRVEEAAGTLDVTSAPGTGTTVRVRLPVRAAG